MPEEMKMTPDVVAALVGGFRELRGWTQETLAELAGINVRSVQRVEAGQPASTETLRAIARAFQAEDIDCFLKTCTIPTKEEIFGERERLERDFVAIDICSPVTSRDLAGASTNAEASAIHLLGEPGSDVEEAFAGLVDYLRDYADCHDCYSEVQRLDVYQDLDRYLSVITDGGFAIGLGLNDTMLVSKVSPDRPMSWRVLYYVCFPASRPPGRLFVPRKPKW
jgi:transcriptional regulator with XRE-family HTH domain